MGNPIYIHKLSILEEFLLEFFLFFLPPTKSKFSALLFDGAWIGFSRPCSYFLVVPTLTLFEMLFSELLDLKSDFLFILLYLGNRPQWKRQIPFLKISITAPLIYIINSIHSMEIVAFTLRLQKENADECWENGTKIIII